MAKQTFTTGQVLTAAQMTSLQQTAMGGGSPSTKTASYVLVAADAGTVIQMNAAGSTTITVNTSLFSAGDSVQIQNIGAGVCTVTAGTATVNTAGSLALSQWEGGFLYFTSASSAIFFDVVQSSGMTNPMTTTGDTIYSSSGSTPARLAIGSTGNVLTVAGGVPTWAAPAGSGGMTELASGSLAASATGFDLTSISGSYNELWLYIANLSADATGGIGYNNSITFNNDTGSNYSVTGTLDGSVRNINNSAVGISLFATETAGTKFSCVVRIPNYTDTTSTKVCSFVGQSYPDKFVNNGAGIWTATPAAINRITLKIGGGAYDGGTYKLYGVK